MSFISRMVFLYASLVLLLLLTGCNEAISKATSSPYSQIPTHSILHKFDLSVKQGLRDIAGDFSVREHGADTSIPVLPDEKVEIFASGSAGVQPGGKQSGPEGISTCREPTMPEPSLPCYSVIYSIGINGRAGEVGTHVGITPPIIGNLFLGVNAPNLASNVGSFHMTVLVIPPGTLAGLWVTPEDGFTIRGTTMTLSAYVFAQSAIVTKVQFTAGVTGQPPVPICAASTDVGDIYSCPWDFALSRSLLGNRPITLGFTLNGNAQSGSTLAPAVSPDGMRTGIVQYVETQLGPNYAGYAATGSTQPAAYQKVTGHWTVPQAQCSPDENSSSAIWVGMTHNPSDNTLLAQLGTESDCLSGSPNYYMWWEMLPAPQIRLDQPLQPGESVTATVTFQSGKFQLSIDNPKEGVHFSTTQPGKVSDTSYAECIVEAPTIIDDLATNKGHIAQLTNFGSVSVFCQLNNNEPLADGPQDFLYQMQTNTGVPKATTSALDQAGSTFTVQWHHG